MRRLPTRWVIVGLLVLIGGGSVFYSFRLSDVSEITAKLDRETNSRLVGAHDARIDLCNQIEHVKSIIAADKQDNLDSSRAFLKKNPQGIPGIPRSLLLHSIALSERRLRLLKPLPCK